MADLTNLVHIAFSTANSADPDEMRLFAASHLGLPCLLMFHYIDTRHKMGCLISLFVLYTACSKSFSLVH